MYDVDGDLFRHSSELEVGCNKAKAKAKGQAKAKQSQRLIKDKGD